MSQSFLDVIVVGAGPAGLSASYYLQQQGLSHLVFERGAIGESWRSQRWDSFLLNTATKLNVLPGIVYKGPEPDGFSTAQQLVTWMQMYVSKYQLPVQEHTTVVSIDKAPGDELFTIDVVHNEVAQRYHAKQVIIASGEANEVTLPALAETIPSSVQQLHAGEYRNADTLPAGAVLVVGSAQSGCQIAEDLALAGRQVFLSTSMVGRLPRRYRGKDIMDWLLELHFFDMRKEDVPDPVMLQLKAPQLSGKGETISLQALAKKGVQIIGKLAHADGRKLFFRPNAAMHVQFADGFSAQVKGMIDGFIEQHKIAAPAAQPDAADQADIDTLCITPVSELALEQISTIIWATGFSGRFDYIKLPVLDEDQRPVHVNGASPVDGLYFLGLHWLRSRKSGLINGIVEDAKFICENLPLPLLKEGTGSLPDLL